MKRLPALISLFGLLLIPPPVAGETAPVPPPDFGWFRARFNWPRVPPPEPVVPAPLASGARGKLRVVIDPGHGGKDWGTIGVCGLHEKDLVLDLGRILFKKLNAQPFFDAILTRDTDVYLTLSDRKVMAREFAADFFVSLHANWGERPTADGPEVYFQNVKATDAEALALAALENRELKEEEKAADRAPVLAAILKDLSETDHLRKSSGLAETIFRELRLVLPGDFRGVRQAPFVVLTEIGRPSVLVEVGFVSNSDDCYFLSTDYGKRIIVDAIGEALRKYGLALLLERSGNQPPPSNPDEK